MNYPNIALVRIVNGAVVHASRRVNEVARLEYLERKYILNARQEPIDRYQDVAYEYSED